MSIKGAFMKKKSIYFIICIFILFGFTLLIKQLYFHQPISTVSSNSFEKLSEKYSDERISDENAIDTINDNQDEYEINLINMNAINLNAIKAVYSSGWVAGGESSRKEMIQNINNNGFNAVVLDIKDEAGHISYSSNVQTAIEIGASRNMIKDIKAVLQDYHENGIYVIGRIVTFKDPTFAKALQDIAYKKEDGTCWTDRSGNYWPNPYNKDSWNYSIALAKEAAELGFDEIQFDYVRFPSSEGRVKQIAFGFNSETVSKSEIINQFLIKVMDELADYKVKVSADVFGITTKRDGDFENIGQDYHAIAKIVDVICPMVYPSHYGKGEYKIANPDLAPYEIVYAAMHDAQDRVSGDHQTAITRPYLQDFTASWLGRGKYQTYNNDAISKQIRACYDLGITSFTLWDPSNQYCYEALKILEEP